MSSVYLTEPPTKGKVLITTNFGDVDVELWPKEAPLACRNFVQLALEGYYDCSIIHRVIKGFMVQMGDPTGTGEGGESIWGRPFRDEFHGKLKFSHRGVLAMANENKPHSNQSQFFITLDACPWLDRKHTIFGKVTGNTIFNVLRMGEVEVGGENGADRPVDDIRIISVQVLVNPFTDVVPRKTVINNAPADDVKEKSRGNRKATKDTKLLSFGAEEDAEEEVDMPKIRIKSSHDSKSKDKKFSSKVPKKMKHLAQDGTADALSSIATSAQSKEEDDDDFRTNSAVHFDKMMREKVLAAKLGKESEIRGGVSAHVDVEQQQQSIGSTDAEDLHRMVEEAKRGMDMKLKNSEYQQLREGLLKSKRAINALSSGKASDEQETGGVQLQQSNDVASSLEQRRQKYAKFKHGSGNRSDQTMAKLMKFTQSLRSAKAAASADGTATHGEEAAYHGQVLEHGEDQDSEMKLWYAGRLKCKKHVDHFYRNIGGDAAIDRGIGADGRAMDEYAVIDPRKHR